MKSLCICVSVSVHDLPVYIDSILKYLQIIVVGSRCCDPGGDDHVRFSEVHLEVHLAVRWRRVNATSDRAGRGRLHFSGMIPSLALG